ncbi:hypothetical protein B7463_g734, partial [Scytalidium lignicola]
MHLGSYLANVLHLQEPRFSDLGTVTLGIRDRSLGHHNKFPFDVHEEQKDTTIMTSAAAADRDMRHISEEPKELKQRSNTREANSDAPAGSTIETQHHDDIDKEDAATIAASEELRHTSISDKSEETPRTGPKPIHHEPPVQDKEMSGAATPEPDVSDAQEEDLRERISSPKKKRGRDQDDDDKEAGEIKEDETGTVSDTAALNGTGLEPDRKRPRDITMGSTAEEEITPVKDIPSNAKDTNKTTSSNEKSSEAKAVFGSSFAKPPQTSSSAFSSSGFGAFASSSASPFGTLAASKPSIFGGNLQSSGGGFGGLSSGKSPNTESLSTSATNKPSLGFGTTFGSTGASGFGALGAKTGGSLFGGSLGNGFAAGGGPKLSSFAAPNKDALPASAKPARAFGAPESDEEEGEEDEGSDGGVASDDEETSKAGGEDKKKIKLAKVHIDDGEAGEATMLQVRAKLFVLDSKEVGWKERGAGSLKINVPKACAEFDDNGAPIPGSFDASGLEDEDESFAGPRVPRLIMRQENTHRVILNTIIVRAMEFKDKPSSSGTQIMFTAFEGEKPINVLVKISEANARLFRSEIDSIKHEL